MGSRFEALIVRQKGVPAELTRLSESELPKGEVLVDVAYSSLNYKDGLAAAGKSGVIRSYPMVPGIDLAGTVAESDSPLFSTGDRVLATGWGLGVSHWGGFAAKARVPENWLMPIPNGMSVRDAMAFGTAGLTAMLCILALERHGISAEPVLVTGAAGGVGSIAIALLRASGFEPIAVTGRPELGPYLKSLGAVEVLGRDNVMDTALVLGPERWRAAIDSVGGTMLAAILSQIAYEGCVAALGLAGGSELNTTVFPFILRGVTLSGIDSVKCLPTLRNVAWDRLAALPHETVAAFSEERQLSEVPELAPQILAGRIRGRVVIRLS